MHRLNLKKGLITAALLVMIGCTSCGYNRSWENSSDQQTETAEAESSGQADAGSGQEESDTDSFIADYEEQNLKPYISGERKKTFRYLQINPDVHVKYVSYDDAVTMLQEGKQFALYYGWTVCPFCRAVIEPLCNAAVETGTTLYAIRVQDGEEGKSRSQYELQDGKAVKTYTNQEYENFITAFGEDTFLKYYLYAEDDTEKENGVDTGVRQMYAPTLLFVKDGTATRFGSEEWNHPASHGTESDRKQLQQQLEAFLKSGELPSEYHG